MYEYLIFFTSLMMLITFYQYIFPMCRRYSSYQEELKNLQRKYNRLLKGRQEMLSHFDWANSRGESLERVE